jgi:hypothetical protein
VRAALQRVDDRLGLPHKRGLSRIAPKREGAGGHFANSPTGFWKWRSAGGSVAGGRRLPVGVPGENLRQFANSPPTPGRAVPFRSLLTTMAPLFPPPIRPVRHPGYEATGGAMQTRGGFDWQKKAGAGRHARRQRACRVAVPVDAGRRRVDGCRRRRLVRDMTRRQLATFRRRSLAVARVARRR